MCHRVISRRCGVRQYVRTLAIPQNHWFCTRFSRLSSSLNFWLLVVGKSQQMKLYVARQNIRPSVCFLVVCRCLCLCLSVFTSVSMSMSVSMSVSVSIFTSMFVSARISGWMHCNTQQYAATHWNTLQHTVTHCNTLQHTATHCNTLQHTATHCNTLQHTATHRNILQHTATHRRVDAMQIPEANGDSISAERAKKMSCAHDVQACFCQFLAGRKDCWALILDRLKVTHCNTLQRAATCCNTLQHSATHSPAEQTVGPSISREGR